MGDLISRAAALNAIDCWHIDFNSMDGAKVQTDCWRTIKELPAVDAVPVTHAEWVYDPDGMDWNLGAWKCSKCHCRNDNLPGNLPKTNPYRWAGSKYCPNCGAKMGKTDV